MNQFEQYIREKWKIPFCAIVGSSSYVGNNQIVEPVKTFYIFGENYEILFQTNEIYIKGNFTKAIERSLKMYGVSTNMMDKENGLESGNSLIEIERNRYTSFSINYQGEKNKDSFSEWFFEYDKQQGYLNSKAYSEIVQKTLEKQSDFFDLMTEKGKKKYYEMLEWEKNPNKKKVLFFYNYD